MNPVAGKLSVWTGEQSACIRIAGRANFALSVQFRQLMKHLRESGHTRVLLDLSDCAFMDSTFLGILAYESNSMAAKGADGVQPGREWTDTLITTEPGGTATVTRTTELRARAAAAWELRPEGEALRLDAAETYQFTGSGDGGGQPLDLSGSGMRAGTDYLAADGRYLGGTSRDSVSLTITLPQQGLTIPQRQLGTLSVQLLPR